MIQACDPNTQEAAWSTEKVPGSQGYTEKSYLKTNKQKECGHTIIRDLHVRFQGFLTKPWNVALVYLCDFL